MNYIKYFLIMLTLFVQTVSAQSVDNPKITYFHNDITGTPIAASDEEGNIIWREERRAYGEIKVDPLKPKTLEEFSVGFTGHQADRESGLIYAKARYYNPNIGRFYAPDPIPFRQNDLVSFNRYAYAANNPYKYVDPTGKEPMRGDSDWDTVNRWGSINSAFNQVGYGLDTYKGEIAVVATGVGTVSMMGTAAIVAGAKEAVSEIASEITGGLSDFLSFKGLFKRVTKGRTFTSTDKHVSDVANAIEKVYPSHVIGVNVPMKRADGSLITDAGILTKNAIIQVKSGGGKGLGGQIQRTEAGTGIPTIGFGPDLKPSILKNSTSTNDLDLLIEVVKT